MKVIFILIAIMSVISVGFSQDTTNITALNGKTIEMMSPEKMNRAKELLKGEGIVLPQGQIVGMAFDPAVANYTSLIVIALDQNLDPIKSTFSVSIGFYSNLIGKALEPTKNETAPQVLKTSAKPVTKKPKEIGRTYFIVSTAIRTLAIYPVGFASALGNSADPRTVTGLSLLTFGGSLYGSYHFTKGRELGYGRVALMNYGGELAVSYSFLTADLLYGLKLFKSHVVPAYTYTFYTPYGKRDTTYYDTVESKTPGKITAIGSMLTFPLGIYLGSISKLAGNYQFGNADIIRFFGRSAWLYGALLPMYGSGGSKYDRSLAFSGFTMCLMPIGIYGGYKLVKDHDYSSGRGLLIETSGIMGALTGLLVPTLFNTDFDHDRGICITSTLAGHALGTAFGFKFKEENSYTFFQGGFMAFSAMCGSAVGLSFPFLAKADSSNPYIIAGLMGGWGGLVAGEYLAKTLFESDTHDQKLSKVDISLPVVYQWPLLLKTHVHERDRYGHVVDNRVDMVRVRIAL